jgi:hypothetical protein
MAVTVTPTVEAGNVPPRVRLDVTSTAESLTTVTRLNPDGTTIPVRTPDGGQVQLSGGTALLYDYEAPFGQPVTYSSQETPSTVSTAITVDASQTWLIHPGVPSLSLPVRLAQGSFSRRTAPARQGVFLPMGRKTPVVVTDGRRKSYQSSLGVVTTTADELAAVEALLDDTGTLLLNIPTTLGYNFPTCYIAVADVDVAPVIDKVFEQWMTVTLPFTVVDRPVGGSQAQRTLADLLAYPTLRAIQDAYPTFAAVLAGP